MPARPLPPLLDQLLQAWRVNYWINIKLVRAIPQKGFAVVPPASRGRTVLQQLMHMHKLYVLWPRYFGAKFPAAIKAFKREATPTRAQLAAAFRAAGESVEEFLRQRIATGRRVKFFQGKPVRWMCYVIAHDSHHRGQIALALKQNGMRLPEKVAINDLWYSWYGGSP